MKHPYTALIVSVALILSVVGCDNITPDPESSTETSTAESQAQDGSMAGPQDSPYEFSDPVFDIAATPDGSILVAESPINENERPPTHHHPTTIKEINRRGVVDVLDISPGDSPINGLESIGRRSFFAASGGLDLTEGAGLWHVSQGGARLVADISAFQLENMIDATEGPAWKNPACEFNPDAGFSAGPHSNPYHLTALSGSETLVADAAGNALLWAKTNGDVDWVAVFTPPVDQDGSSSVDPDDWMVLFPLDEDVDCYVQPVPTAVDVGPDGAYYVGELTGVTPADIGTGGGPTKGLSRVWRIEPGAQNVTCPSDDCEVVLSGFSSVIDLEFGPSGELYVVEYDENGWFAATELDDTAGGTVNQCDVDAGTCVEVESDLTLPAAITFDKWGNLWLLENNLATPTVDQVDLP